MFTSSKRQEIIRKNAYDAAMSAFECHANVRQSIVLAYRADGINPTNEVVNELTEEVQKVWANSHLHQSVSTPKSRLWSL